MKRKAPRRGKYRLQPASAATIERQRAEQGKPRCNICGEVSHATAECPEGPRARKRGDVWVIPKTKKLESILLKQRVDKLPKGSPMEQLFQRWKNGERLFELSAESKIKRSKLRRGFAGLAGGKPAFAALRQQGAGGKVEMFNGKRRTGPTVSDKGVPTTAQMSYEAGWQCDWRGAVRLNVGVLMVSPSGKRYVPALDSEKADLIHIRGKEKWFGLKPIRLRKLDDSRQVKKAREKIADEEHGAQLLKATRARKRAQRKARKARRAKGGRS